MSTQLCPRRDSRSPGFTLVELLVVIAIIGILVALLLPAVQAAREAARRTECRNKVKQIALAVQNYHDSYNELPLGIYADPNPGSSGGNNDSQGLSWFTRILPYVEETVLYDQIAAFDVPDPSGYDGPWRYYRLFDWARAQGITLPGENVSIAAFNCPSAIMPEVVPESASSDRVWGMATGSYKGSKGLGQRGLFFRPERLNQASSAQFAVQDGALPDPVEVEARRYTRIRFKDITDGLSKTVAVAESAYAIAWSPGGAERWPIWYGTPGQGYDEGALFSTEFFVNCRYSEKKFYFGYNDPAVAAVRTTFDQWKQAVPVDDRIDWDVNDCAYGWHPGGVMVGLADGSAHFLSDDFDLRPWMYMGDPTDGEVVADLSL